MALSELAPEALTDLAAEIKAYRINDERTWGIYSHTDVGLNHYSEIAPYVLVDIETTWAELTALLTVGA
jgi:hypothetical protein